MPQTSIVTTTSRITGEPPSCPKRIYRNQRAGGKERLAKRGRLLVSTAIVVRHDGRAKLRQCEVVVRRRGE